MKKILFYIVAAALSLLALESCNKVTTEGKTRITYYPVIELVGGDVVLPLGQTYSEPGYAATLNGENVTDKVEVSNNIKDVAGAYTVSYSMTNADGFASAVKRNVFVTNGTAFDNFYFADTQYGTRAYYGAPVTISKNSDGTYTIDDLLCGFYWYGRYPGYEPTYDFHNESIIKLNADNTITLVEQGDWYFGPAGITITSSKYDPAAGTIEMEYDFEGDPFYVSMAVPTAE